MAAAQPADVDRLFAKALSEGDLEAAVAMYEPDACYTFTDGSVARGHAQIRETLATLIDLQPTLDCYAISVVETGDLALLQADWTFSGTDADGAKFANQGRSIEVVRRQPDGSWRFSIDLPEGAETPLL